jgi:hypothetical protein
MTRSSLETVILALNAAEVRYLVVGGLAVIAHGYLRSTADLDLLIQLEPKNILAAFQALEPLGYKPVVPVTAADFADPSKRNSWITEKEMKVLKLHSDTHRETPIDLFVSDPLGFDDAAKRMQWYPLGEGVPLPVCSYADLVALKLQASRPKDQLDLQNLKRIRGEP